MAYISKPLVRKFRNLEIRRFHLFKFEIFHTILRNRSTLTPIFSQAVYIHFTNIKWRHWYDRRVLPDDLSTFFWMVILCWIMGIKRGHFGLR